MGNMRFKEGDRVRIKSFDWYNENKDEDDEIWCFPYWFGKEHSKWCGKVMTISCVKANYYTMTEVGHFYWTDEMIEGLAEEELSLDKAGQITDFEYEGLAYTLPEGYQFVDENGNVINAQKIVLEKKKKEYPKTYEECSKIDPMTWGGANFKYYNTLLSSFYKLLICRNAYWKIAGREMGLGISWKPSWDKCTGEKYCISRVLNTLRHDAVSNSEYHNRILAFPTEEMRDAFYENFKELIEQCKELL